MEDLRAGSWACGFFCHIRASFVPWSTPPRPMVAIAFAPCGILISLSCPQLHSEPARGVNAAAGLPEAAAGQQGAVGGPAAAAAGTAAERERGTQAAAAGWAPEAHRGTEGAAAAPGGGEDLPGHPLCRTCPGWGHSLVSTVVSQPWHQGHSPLGAHTS